MPISGYHLAAFIVALAAIPCFAEPGLVDPAYFHEGPLAGSLRDSTPLAIYDEDGGHLWNRVFAALYTRESNLPPKPGEPPIRRIEGGDIIDFLAWGKTTYWSSQEMYERLDALFDEFLSSEGDQMISDPLRRSVFLRDLWAAFDFLINQNILRRGTPEERGRHDQLCGKLAAMVASLALNKDEISRLPDTYSLAVGSGDFANDHWYDSSRDYLPAELLSNPDKWAEIDFYRPERHGELLDRFVTAHTRSYLGRSYFRIFYHYPKGRSQVEEHLAALRQEGVDWKQAAQNGFIMLTDEAPQIPVHAEFALVQFMMTLDDELRPVPTKIVESIRMRFYGNLDGTDEPPTNTGRGMEIREYTMSRRLLFDSLRNGGLHREPDDLPQYRALFQNKGAPDWGFDRRKVLSQQCADCHLAPGAKRTGVQSIFSIINMGGSEMGVQLGVSETIPAAKHSLRGRRAAVWKTRHETYRRLLEYVGR